MSELMRVWRAVERPPAEALKTIKGGRLQGMTDVNPQWRYKAMTEVFGPCGVGWKWSIDKLWTDAGTDGQVMVFASVSVCTREGRGEWSEPIPGIGGSVLIAKESAGLRSNDEAYKMAVTDALSVALKFLGVAADIYAGRWDGSKWNDGGNDSVLAVPFDELGYRGWLSNLELCAPSVLFADLVDTIKGGPQPFQSRLRTDKAAWTHLKGLTRSEVPA